jgi:hypothetical protein
MATITLKYNARTKGIQSILTGLLEMGIFEVEPVKKGEMYNPEFVKMIKEQEAAPKKTMSLDEIKERLGYEIQA